MRYMILLILAVSGLSIASAAPRDRVEAPFTYTHDQLNSPDGAQDLFLELVSLGKQVCKMSYTDERLQTRAFDADCLEAFVLDAVTKIDAPALRAAFDREFE